MSTAARKARKRAGEKFQRDEKTPTGVYISKSDQRKATKAFEQDLAARVRAEFEKEDGDDDRD